MVKRAEQGDSIIFSSQFATRVSSSLVKVSDFNEINFHEKSIGYIRENKSPQNFTNIVYSLKIIFNIYFVFSVDIGSVNSSGLLKAAVAREAKYTYQTNLTFKGAVYIGMWMAGEPHGRLVR